MAPEKGRRCQVCGGVVSRVSKGGTVDYCNMCKSCGRVVHISCASEIKDIRVAGDFWLCQCGTRNQIYSCRDWSIYD
jgi:hypothetical protein